MIETGGLKRGNFHRKMRLAYLAQLSWQDAADVTVVLVVLYIDAPRRIAVEAFVGGIASPKALYEHRCGRNLTVEVLLTLFLLHFQSEARSEDTLCGKTAFFISRFVINVGTLRAGARHSFGV